MVTFSQGETILLQVPFSTEGGTPVDFSTATSIRAYFLVKGKRVFSFMETTLETAITGYGSLTIENPYTLNFDISQAISKTLPIGELTIAVGAIFPTSKDEYLKQGAALITEGFVLKNETY